MSTKAIVVGTTRAGFTIAAIAASRGSGTGTTPVFGSIVQNGKFSAAMPAFVSALKSVDLPTFGNPTMPQLKPMSVARVALGVQHVHRFAERARQYVAQHVVGNRRERIVDLRALVLRQARAGQITAHPFGIAGMPDADAQAHELGAIAQSSDHVVHAVVTVVAAALLQAHHAGLECDLVVRDQDRF